jgi:hypothetical protein
VIAHAEFSEEALRRIAERQRKRGYKLNAITAANQLKRRTQKTVQKLWMLTGEATALARSVPDNPHLLNTACIVRGYVEAFPLYGGDNPFPWEYVQAIVARMREGVRTGDFRRWHVSARVTPETVEPNYGD